MALFDFIRNFRNNNTPQIQAVIQDQPIMNSKQYPLPGTIAEQPQGNGLFNKIRGKIGNGFNGVNLFDKYDNPTNEVNYTSTDENGDTVLNSTVGTPVLTQRGFLNDFSRGFKDNAYNGFKVENLQADKLNDMPKNFANRLGEAIGTAGRVLNSPLGRGLLTAGIVGATGGSGLEALAYGGQAGVTNQQLVNNDRMYRQALNDAGIDTSGATGYIGKDDYNSLIQNNVRMQNSQYQNALRRLQIEKQQIINSNLPEHEKAKLIKENAEAEYAVRMQEAKINAFNNGIALGWSRFNLANDKFNWEKERADNKPDKAPNKQQILTNPTVRENLVEYNNTRNAAERRKMSDWFIKETGYTPEYLMGVQ